MVVNHKPVAAIMGELGRRVFRGHGVELPTDSGSTRHPTCSDPAFTASRPTDITEHPARDGKVYLPRDPGK